MTVAAGKQAEVVAGSLRVAGTGKERYHVLDATGQRELTGYIATNSTAELLPGTYTVELNGTRDQVTVAAGKQAEVVAGSLRVAGTGKERYHVLDATGQRELTGYIATNSTAELLPGTYVVKVGDRSMTARVHAGQQTNVSP